MKLTADDYEAAEKHCFRHWRVRLTPTSSRELIRTALDLKVLSPGCSRDWLTDKLTLRVRHQHPRNWALVWLLIQYVLPIIIELVIEWWERRQQTLMLMIPFPHQ